MFPHRRSDIYHQRTEPSLGESSACPLEISPSFLQCSKNPLTIPVSCSPACYSISLRVSAHDFCLRPPCVSGSVERLNIANNYAATRATQIIDPSTLPAPSRCLALSSMSPSTTRMPSLIRYCSRYTSLPSSSSRNLCYSSRHLDSSSLLFTPLISVHTISRQVVYKYIPYSSPSLAFQISVSHALPSFYVAARFHLPHCLGSKERHSAKSHKRISSSSFSRAGSIRETPFQTTSQPAMFARFNHSVSFLSTVDS